MLASWRSALPESLAWEFAMMGSIGDRFVRRGALPHGGARVARPLRRRFEGAAGKSQPLVVAGTLGQVAAEVDQPHVQRAELLGAVEVQALALEDDQIL